MCLPLPWGLLSGGPSIGDEELLTGDGELDESSAIITVVLKEVNTKENSSSPSGSEILNIWRKINYSILVSCQCLNSLENDNRKITCSVSSHQPEKGIQALFQDHLVK